MRPKGAVTQREVDVLLAVADAKDFGEAAAKLNITQNVVRNTLARVRQKLGVETNMQALRALVGGVRYVETRQIVVDMKLEEISDG